MSTKRLSYFWLSLFASCTLAYQLIQDIIRPGYAGSNPIARYLLGVAPNFLPAIGLPAFFVVLLPYVAGGVRKNHPAIRLPHITANLVSLTGLIAWECIQNFSSRGHFDWNDVLFTLLGGLVFHGIWMVSKKGE